MTALGYVAQLYSPSAVLLKAEKSAVQRIYHFLNNTLPSNLYFVIKKVGAPQANYIKLLTLRNQVSSSAKDDHSLGRQEKGAGRH